VGAAKRNDTELISVVLASGWGTAGKNNKWSDTKKILDYGFNNFEKRVAVKNGDIISNVCVDKAKESSVQLYSANDLQTLAKKDENIVPDFVLHIPKIIDAPVQKGQKIGTADVIVNNVSIGSVDLLAAQSIEKFNMESNFIKTWKNWFTAFDLLFNI
jgi:D-alanyl-D-alanine carboxypeptidase (penicillin-binding protein 5/6)